MIFQMVHYLSDALEIYMTSRFTSTNETLVGNVDAVKSEAFLLYSRSRSMAAVFQHMLADGFTV